MSENVLPKEQTSTPLMSDLERSVKVLQLKRLKLPFPKKLQKRLLLSDLIKAQPLLDNRSEALFGPS